MGLLEDEVRGALHRQVADAPSMEDVAGRAMRGAERIRAQRAAVGTALFIVSVALVGAGSAVLHARGRTSHAGSVVPVASATVAAPGALSTFSRLPVDVLVNGEIHASDGRVVGLRWLPGAWRVWRVSTGWIVQTTQIANTAAVWFTDGSSAPVKLADGDQVAVESQASGIPRGPRVAAGRSGKVSVGTFAQNQLSDIHETNGTGTLRPVGFAADGVLLGGPAVQGGSPPYEMWFPARGAYRSGPRGSDPILATTADGDQLFGLVSGASAACLAVIDPAGFTVVRKACPPGVLAGNTAFPSPDGRWLVTLGGGRITLYDLNQVWSDPRPVSSWQLAATNVAWLDDGTFVVGVHATLVSVDPHDPAAARATPVAGTEGPVTVIPRLSG
jgi:hypothetical protein